MRGGWEVGGARCVPRGWERNSWRSQAFGRAAHGLASQSGSARSPALRGPLCARTAKSAGWERWEVRGARFALSARAMYMRTLFHDSGRAYRLSCDVKPRSGRGQVLQLRRRRFHAGSWLASGRCSQRTGFNQLARFFSLSSTISSSRLLRWPRRAGAGAGPDSPHPHLAQCGRSALTGSLH